MARLRILLFCSSTLPLQGGSLPLVLRLTASSSEYTPAISCRLDTSRRAVCRILAAQPLPPPPEGPLPSPLQQFFEGGGPEVLLRRAAEPDCPTVELREVLGILSTLSTLRSGQVGPAPVTPVCRGP